MSRLSVAGTTESGGTERLRPSMHINLHSESSVHLLRRTSKSRNKRNGSAHLLSNEEAGRNDICKCIYCRNKGEYAKKTYMSVICASAV